MTSPLVGCVSTLQQIAVSRVVMVRSAATAKCTQPACVTINYGSFTFHETVIEPGALPLFKTTGVLQSTSGPRESLSSSDVRQQKPPRGTPGILETG